MGDTYEIQWGRAKGEKTDPVPRSFVTLLGYTEYEALQTLWRLKRKPFYKERETWLAYRPSDRRIDPERIAPHRGQCTNNGRIQW